MIDIGQLNESIAQILEPLLLPIPVIGDYQSDIRPAPLYLVYRICDIQETGMYSESPVDDNGISTISHLYKVYIRFTFIGNGSPQQALQLHAMLTRPSILQQFIGIGLGHFNKGPIKDSPRFMTNGFEESNTFEMGYYLEVLDEDDQGWIETVDLEVKALDGTNVVYDNNFVINPPP